MKSFLKSAFISVFPVLGLVVAVLGGYSLLENGFEYASLGRLISGLTVTAFFGGLFLIPQARTTANLRPYTVFIILGTIPAIQHSSENYTLYALSLLLVIGWILYLNWYSKFSNRDSSVLEKGKELPSFELEKTNGQKISNTRFLGNPSIYLFYRGNWCPLCMAQIQEIANQYKELEKLGAQMVFISPQPHAQTESLSKKYDLGFHYLQDTNNQVAKQLGILSEAGIPMGFQVFGYDSETVMPTVVITDNKGIIQFVDLTDNYRVRPEPKTFLEVIRNMK